MTTSLAPHPKTRENAPRGVARACHSVACGVVGRDVVVYDVSNLAGTVRIALCPRDVARWRAEFCTIVERVDEIVEDRSAPAEWVRCSGPCGGREMKRAARVVWREGSDERETLLDLECLQELVQRGASVDANAPRGIRVLRIVEAAGCPA
jgi:hypothetical protein